MVNYMLQEGRAYFADYIDEAVRSMTLKDYKNQLIFLTN